MACYRSGGCGPYEMYSCSECPASKPEYAQTPSTCSQKEQMRLIDADALLRKLCAERDEVQIEHACDVGYHNGLNMAASMTINAPAIDPESLRPQGEWAFKHPNGWACSNCGEWGLMIDNRGIAKSNYCPNCGAYMKGAGEDA